MKNFNGCKNCEAVHCNARNEYMKIKPCPICGNDEIDFNEKKIGKEHRIMYRIICKKCGCNLACYDPCKGHLISKWNKRAEVQE